MLYYENMGKSQSKSAPKDEKTLNISHSPKKKVLLVITKSNWGGAQKYVYDLATSGGESGFDFVVAVGGDGELKKRLFDAGIPILGINGLGRDISFTKDFRVLFSLLSLLWKEQPDVLHVNSSKIGGLGAVAGRIYNIFHFSKKTKVVFTAHGWAFNEDRSTIAKIAIKFFAWLTIMFSHTTIAVSHTMKEQTRGWPFVHDRIHVIYNGVFPTVYLKKIDARLELFSQVLESNVYESVVSGITTATVKAEREMIAERLEKSFIIGTVAELHHIKGLRYAIEAIAKLVPTYPELLYVVIGEGEDRPNLQKLIEALDLSRNVFLVGHKAEAARLLQAFNIFTLPSLSEGLAYAILEAGQAGLPVIASRVGGIPEIIDDADAGKTETGVLVDARDSDALAAAFAELIENPEKRSTLGDALKHKVDTQFSKAIMITKTEALY